MYGLTSVISLATEALNADSGAIAITSNNVSNVNTAGYSRQLVNLSASALTANGVTQDNGVTFGGFTSVRNQVLQLAINQKTSDVGSLNAQSTLYAQIDSAFSGTTTGLGASISNLFSSLSALTTAPTDGATRQQAFAAVNQLTSAFHQNASDLAVASSAADQQVTATVTQVNQLTSQIANLDGQLALVQGDGQDGGSLQDQRDQLTTQLSQLVGTSSISTEGTPTLTLSDGTALVIGGIAYKLNTGVGSDGKAHVFGSSGQDIGAEITGGALGGALQARDQEIPKLQTTLNSFATDFATALNAAQVQGFDASGNQGQPIFTLPSSGVNAAATLSVNITNSSAIAASSDGSVGGTGNVAKLMAVQTAKLASGHTPTDTYAMLTQTIGDLSSGTNSQLDASNAALSQLATAQSKESGVSIDEETTNLLRYQQAYSAAAQVISTVNNLFSIVLNMGSGAA